MQKRKRSVAPKLFFIGGIFLLLLSAVIALPSLVRQGWVEPEWQERVDLLLREARRMAPTEEQLAFVKWLGGLALAAAGAASALLVSWHFAEINLPQRIQDLKRSHTRNHLSLQPTYLALSRRGLGAIPADIETSRLTLLRKWLSGWSKREQARVLAASTNQLAREVSALSAATSEAQHELITAHLIRGYQHEVEGDLDLAFDEFEAATMVQINNVLSRDIAAGCARRLGRQKRELELLEQMENAATRSDIDRARALRRKAELLKKRQDESNRREALSLLIQASGLVAPGVAADDSRQEMIRILTLHCEIQCERKVVRRLVRPNGEFTKLRSFSSQVEMRSRLEERGGEEYSANRVEGVGRRIADLLADQRSRTIQQPANE